MRGTRYAAIVLSTIYRIRDHNDAESSLIMFMTLNRFHIKHRLSTYVLNHDVFWKALRPQLGEKWLHAKYPLCMLSYSYSGLVHHAAKCNNIHVFLLYPGVQVYVI